MQNLYVADDSQGKGILDELDADGVDTSLFVVSKEGNSPFTYVIVDSQMKSCTCIHTPGYPPMIPADLSQACMSSALDGVSIVCFDGRLHETALVIGKEAWTEAASIPDALVSMLLRLPKLKFVIVTLGDEGCIMLQRSLDEASKHKETDIDSLLVSLKQRKDGTATSPTYVSSATMKLKAKGIGTLSGRLFLGTAEKIPPEELIDTTGAGDVFIEAILYAICAGNSPERMLPFASQVAACACRALGACTGLPHRTDPRLLSCLV